MAHVEDFTEAELMDRLRDCFAPRSERNIVNAGLVRSATLERDLKAPGSEISGVPARYIARITLTAPGSDEALNAQVRAIVENRLLGLPQISRAEITMLLPLFSILG